VAASGCCAKCWSGIAPLVSVRGQVAASRCERLAAALDRVMEWRQHAPITAEVNGNLVAMRLLGEVGFKIKWLKSLILLARSLREGDLEISRTGSLIDLRGRHI
jgi:hypothetical protein